jgi:uncharacterized protein YceK
MNRCFILLVSAALLSGCASVFFRTERKSGFTDANNTAITVEYGTEEREERLSGGAVLKFNRKVRITLPDGRRVILYQTLSPSGVRYRSADSEYIFIEQGPWCKLIRGGVIVYQGVFSRNFSVER